MSNPNENCLEGRQCPECGSYGPFCIVVMGWATLYDDGTDEIRNVEYDDGSEAECPSCHYASRWSDFGDSDGQAYLVVLLLPNVARVFVEEDIRARSWRNAAKAAITRHAIDPSVGLDEPRVCYVERRADGMRWPLEMLSLDDLNRQQPVCEEE